jgi:type IV pilus assembly protein PilQ
MKRQKLGNLLVALWAFAALSLSGVELYGQDLPVSAANPALQEKLNERIFLDLRDINVVDLFKFLAVKGNLNIVTSKNVEGRSTLVLHDVAIRDALEILIISNQLAYEIQGDIIYIMTEEEYNTSHGKSFNDKRQVLTRSLKYAKPSYVLTTLEALQGTLGKVVVDEGTGTVVMIDTSENLKKMESVLDGIEKRSSSQVVELQYAKAKDVEAQLKAKVDDIGVGSITADERSNQLFLTAYPERMEEIIPMISALDKKTKAVLIEARILQLTLNPKYDAGIDWEKAFRNFKHADLKNLDFRSAFPIDSEISSDEAIGTVGKIAVGEISDDQFEVALKMLKEVENTKVLANPRMMIVDGQESKINIADRIPYVITTTTGTGANVSVSEDIKFIDVGIILTVTPRINDEGLIHMVIRPEISSKIGDITAQESQNDIPIVNTTFIETSAIVKDGATVILGGLRRDEVTESSRGLPYLMDIPVLGNLFKNRNEELLRSEIVILITPKIFMGDTDFIDQPLPILKSYSSMNPSSNNQHRSGVSGSAAEQPIPILTEGL